MKIKAVFGKDPTTHAPASSRKVHTTLKVLLQAGNSLPAMLWWMEGRCADRVRLRQRLMIPNSKFIPVGRGGQAGLNQFLPLIPLPGGEHRQTDRNVVEMRSRVPTARAGEPEAAFPLLQETEPWFFLSPTSRILLECFFSCSSLGKKKKRAQVFPQIGECREAETGENVHPTHQPGTRAVSQD